MQDHLYLRENFLKQALSFQVNWVMEEHISMKNMDIDSNN